MALKRKRDSPGEEEEEKCVSLFSGEVLERVFRFVKSHKDRSSISLVRKDWYSAERWSRTHVFIGNCYSVSPDILFWGFPNIQSVTLKGKPRFSDFNLVLEDWGADIHWWLEAFASSSSTTSTTITSPLKLSDILSYAYQISYKTFASPEFGAGQAPLREALPPSSL